MRTSAQQSNALIDRLGKWAGKLRAGQVATIRLPPTFDSICVRRRERWRWRFPICNKPWPSKNRCERRVCGARLHASTARPTESPFGQELAKHVHAFNQDLDRLRDWDVRTSVSPLTRERFRDRRSRSTPRPLLPNLVSQRRSQLHRCRIGTRTSRLEFLLVTAMIRIHLSRLGRRCVCGHQRVRIRNLA